MSWLKKTFTVIEDSIKKFDDACTRVEKSITGSEKTFDDILDEKLNAFFSEDESAPAQQRESDRPENKKQEKTRLSLTTKVAGVAYKNDDGTGRQEILEECEIGERVNLVRDPQNQYDPNAVRICRSNEQQIGFVPADLAPRLAHSIDTGRKFEGTVSNLTGGGDYRRGCVIDIYEIVDESIENGAQEKIQRLDGEEYIRYCIENDESVSLTPMGSCSEKENEYDDYEYDKDNLSPLSEEDDWAAELREFEERNRE